MFNSSSNSNSNSNSDSNSTWTAGLILGIGWYHIFGDVAFMVAFSFCTWEITYLHQDDQKFTPGPCLVHKNKVN